MVSTACHQLMPSAMSDEASMYVGMQAERATQRAATSHSPQVRADGGTGARSGLQKPLPAAASLSLATAASVTPRGEISAAPSIFFTGLDSPRLRVAEGCRP